MAPRGDESTSREPGGEVAPSVLLEVSHVDKVYDSGEVSFHALRDVSLEVRRGELVAVIGASGSGKSTLMNLIGCLDQPTAGTYRLAGHDVSKLDDEALAVARNRLLGFVFQGFYLLPRTTALENVELPLIYRGLATEDRQRRAAAALITVGLGDRLLHTPSQLSGGQQQRVAIARALAGNPAVLLADEPTGNLDSKTTVEVLGLLQRLNRERGLTIVLVTHDPEVAAHASRIVTVKDGGIASDVRNPSPRQAASPALPSASQLTAAASGRRHPVVLALAMAWMATRLAMRALARNKLRGGLTVLGILIGVAAVVAMTTIGAGAQARMATQMSSLGVNMIMIWPGQTTSGGARSGAGGSASLTSTDAEAIASEVPSVVAVAPQITFNTQVVAGPNNSSTRVTGTTSAWFRVRNWTAEHGALFDPSDERRRGKVCVIGQTVADNIFPGEAPVGEAMRVGQMPCTVIGVLARKGQSSFGTDQDDVVVMPLSTFRANIGRSQGDSVQQISASAATRTITDHAQEQITLLLHQRHHIGPNEEDDFQVRNLEEIARTFDEQAQTIATLLLIVASIALLVGGIGVMNIMLVSVTERTREIGIRRAIGARGIDVLSQFLVEAVALSAVGGLAGLATGLGASALIAALTEFKVLFQPTSAIVSVIVSALIGVVFGFFPARAASRLDPITALRHE